jgi:hypothetical protein
MVKTSGGLGAYRTQSPVVRGNCFDLIPRVDPAQCMSTHVPCFPVKPWKSTLVSPLIRRFLIVSAYCEEPVAYCLVADLESAERRGCRRACIVAGSGHEGRAECTEGYREVRRGWSWFRASRKLRHMGGNSSAAAWPVTNSPPTSRPRPTTSRKYLVNQSSFRNLLDMYGRYQPGSVTEE